MVMPESVTTVAATICPASFTPGDNCVMSSTRPTVNIVVTPMNNTM